MISWIFALLFALQAASPAPDATETYYIAFLRPDPGRQALSKEESQRIQAAHMANIRSMADQGVLVAAGPFDDTPPAVLGVFVLKAATLDEAKRIANQDPTVTSHRTLVDAYLWRGPSGIGAEYFRLHKENPATPEGMGIQPLVLLYRTDGWSQSPELATAHREYVERLRREGKLAAAGAVEDSDLVGMEVFQRIPDTEARRLVSEDPAVKAGALRPELHRWWCAEHVLPWH